MWQQQQQLQQLQQQLASACLRLGARASCMCNLGQTSSALQTAAVQQCWVLGRITCWRHTARVSSVGQGFEALTLLPLLLLLVLLQVTDALTGKPAVDAEVTVVVVDESILALLPYPLPVSASTKAIAAFLVMPCFQLDVHVQALMGTCWLAACVCHAPCACVFT